MTAKLLHITGKVMASLLLAVIVGALAVLTVIPRAVDGAALTVLTGSMTPEIPVGSVVVVRPVDPGTLEVGDIVTYQKDPGQPVYVTHRIQAVHANTDPVTLTTKGDANRGADLEPVPVTAVRGEVIFSVPFLGTVREAIGTGSMGLLLLVIALVGYALGQVFSALRDRPALSAGTPGDPARLVEASGGQEAGPQLRLQLLVATLQRSAVDGFSPGLVAGILHVDLVDEGPEHFTVTAVREPAEINELVQALEPFGPIQVQRSATVSVLSCSTVAGVLADVLVFPTGGEHVAA